MRFFDSKSECFGCGACLSACPKGAMFFETDKYGFLYPAIEERKCVSCGKCISVCPIHNIANTSEPLTCYAATLKDNINLFNSSSGGAFYALGRWFLQHNGVVYGASYDENLAVRHCRAETIEELKKLQGSKYVKSDTSLVFPLAKKDLNNNIKVLFSGTPCQVAALKAYLGKEYENLFTVDVVCHGTPSQKMFSEYIADIEKRYGKSVKSYKFRNKKHGWGTCNSVVFSDGKEALLHKSDNPFLYFFYTGQIARECCYVCPFASKKRVSDLSLCDFWGIYQTSFSFARNHGKQGVSGVMCNGEKGKVMLKKVEEEMNLLEVSANDLAVRNQQLLKPLEGQDKKILEHYASEGYTGLHDLLGRRLFLDDKIPLKVKHYLKLFKGLIKWS